MNEVASSPVSLLTWSCTVIVKSSGFLSLSLTSAVSSLLFRVISSIARACLTWSRWVFSCLICFFVS